MQEDKPLTKMEWMKQELNNDGFYPSEDAINKIIEGQRLEFFEDALVDYILELESEWASGGNR